MTTVLTYPELISEIRRLSLEKKNGTIFITSTDGHIARIVLNEGTITYLIFDSNHSGSEAIPRIQAIKLARLQFVGGIFESYQASTLPSTEEIFDQLSAVKIIPEKSCDFSTPTNTTPDNNLILADINKAIEDIKLTLADYIGPIANILCDNYIQQIKPKNTKSDITVMIETLAIEIEPAYKQYEFKNNILNKLFYSSN